MLVGTCVDSGLERVVEYLGEYHLPVSVISFEVFVLVDGSLLLVREVIEEQVAAQSEQSKTKSLDELRRQANRFGVGPDFDRLVTAAEGAGLYVRPYVRSVMLAPASARYRFLMAARPQADGRMRLSYGPDAFAEFYPDLSAEDVSAAIAGKEDGIYEGAELTNRVSAFVEFLAELPPPEAEGGGQGGTANTETVLALAACIREGEWATYGDISTAATGSSSAAMAVGNIARTNGEFPSPHRIPNRDGRIPTQWTDGLGGGPEVCRARLEAEGVTFLESGAADLSGRVAPEVLRARAEQDG